ncbi:MAG: phosphate/phosphite/phosphonate ABC transporter substrate-binding protein [Cycloclasticus sp.]|nr:phosphate/phosphite/phosphonate ABC transporter substrate-binding protein [Cycloclasticus sp.]MBQ0789165.1 phosphate/phosphite/phosphonate ABC transporter substrate-binding protein [Cycloclasticus sp.]
MTRLLKLITLLVLGIPTSVLASETYTVGVVPQFGPRQITQIWQPILSEVSRSSGVQLRLKASPNMATFEKQLNNGVFDFAYMSPNHAVTTHRRQTYKPLLKDRERQLFGIIVVKKDSLIQSVQELNGQTIAFPSSSAIGATLLPKAELSRKFNITMNSLYVKSHSSVYFNVVMGTVIAGGGVQKTFAQQDKKIRDKLRILYATESVSPHPIGVHSRVSQAVQEKITSAFLALDQQTETRQLLAKIPIKKIGSATISDYDAVKKLQLETFQDNKSTQ